MGGSSSTIFCKVSSVPCHCIYRFFLNVACVDNSLTDLKPKVKVVRSPRGAIIWFFFSSKFEVTEARENFEDFRKFWDHPNG